MEKLCSDLYGIRHFGLEYDAQDLHVMFFGKGR